MQVLVLPAPAVLDDQHFVLAVHDLNGNGKLDIVLAAGGNQSVNVALGNGDGTFQPEVNRGIGGTAEDVAVADFNGDGKLDAVAATGVAARVKLWK